MVEAAFTKIAVGMNKPEVAALLEGIRVVKSDRAWSFVEPIVGAPKVGHTYPVYRIVFENGAVVAKEVLPGLDVTGVAPR